MKAERERCLSLPLFTRSSFTCSGTSWAGPSPSGRTLPSPWGPELQERGGAALPGSQSWGEPNHRNKGKLPGGEGLPQHSALVTVKGGCGVGGVAASRS